MRYHQGMAVGCGMPGTPVPRHNTSVTIIKTYRFHLLSFYSTIISANTFFIYYHFLLLSFSDVLYYCQILLVLTYQLTSPFQQTPHSSIFTVRCWCINLT